MLLIIIISTYFVLLIVSIFYKFKQPKEIGMYGYRTFLSMKSKENWLYANKLASSYMGIVTHVILFLSLIVYKLQIMKCLSLNFSVVLIAILIPLVCFILMIGIIESKLSKRDDEI